MDTIKLGIFISAALLSTSALAVGPPPVPTQDVNVVNTPGVTVENDSNSPVPVTVTNAGNTYRFVGISTTSTSPDVGINNMTATCQADFGSTAKISTTEELFSTTNWPSLTTSFEAWVQPVVTSMYP